MKLKILEFDDSKTTGSVMIHGRSAPIFVQNHDGVEVVFNHNREEINDPRLDESKLIFNKQGRPFRTKELATSVMWSKDGTHIIVRYNGGYALCPMPK